MTYQNKVKASKRIIQAITALSDKEQIKVEYGKGYRGEPNIYNIKAYSDVNGEMTYSIWNHFSGMNIDSLTPTMAKAYSYDMMMQRTTYTFPLYDMTIVK